MPGGGPDVLADSITEILQPEDVEKLETALQSVHAKEILGDVVLGMLFYIIFLRVLGFFIMSERKVAYLYLCQTHIRQDIGNFYNSQF